MRVMVIGKATRESESGAPPSAEALEAMGKFNEELMKAGVILAAEGLQPSSKGARVRFGGRTATVIDGPFPETKELIAGFMIWKVKSLQEAIDLVKRSPFPEGEVEIRQIYETEEFAANLPAEEIERKKGLRSKLAFQS